LRSKGAPLVAGGPRRALPQKFWRAEIERRFAGKKLEIAIDRFINPGKSDIVRFLNEHYDA